MPLTSMMAMVCRNEWSPRATLFVSDWYGVGAVSVSSWEEQVPPAMIVIALGIRVGSGSSPGMYVSLVAGSCPVLGSE